MNKIVVFDPQADKEFHELNEIVQNEFFSLIKILQIEGRLTYPDAKKVDKNIFEIRVKINNIYRGFYAYIKSNHIVILHIFLKKTQKTPLKNLKTAHKRLQIYE